jgi:ABC-type oligopeptide transport system ATPase subunit
MSVIQECMQDNDNILQVENICKYYKAGSGRLFDKTVFKAVNQVSFSVKRGETFGLVGESGCGKSTLAKLVMKLLEASGGRVLFDGKDITKMPKRQLDAIRKDMQIVFQDPYDSLNPRFNLKQIVSEPMENFGYSRSMRALKSCFRKSACRRS